jgi:hypothetical protein
LVSEWKEEETMWRNEDEGESRSEVGADREDIGSLILKESEDG